MEDTYIVRAFAQHDTENIILVISRKNYQTLNKGRIYLGLHAWF